MDLTLRSTKRHWMSLEQQNELVDGNGVGRSKDDGVVRPRHRDFQEWT